MPDRFGERSNFHRFYFFRSCVSQENVCQKVFLVQRVSLTWWIFRCLSNTLMSGLPNHNLRRLNEFLSWLKSLIFESVGVPEILWWNELITQTKRAANSGARTVGIFARIRQVSPQNVQCLTSFLNCWNVRLWMRKILPFGGRFLSEVLSWTVADCSSSDWVCSVQQWWYRSGGAEQTKKEEIFAIKPYLQHVVKMNRWLLMPLTLASLCLSRLYKFVSCLQLSAEMLLNWEM